MSQKDLNGIPEQIKQKIYVEIINYLTSMGIIVQDDIKNVLLAEIN